MTPFDQTIAHVKEHPTKVFGLRFFPSLEPECSDDQDMPNWGFPGGPEVSDCNISIVKDVVARMSSRCRAIMEIGVHRNDSRSMSNILMDEKPHDCIYLGVDLDDKSHLDRSDLNIHTIRANSHDKLAIREKLRALGVGSLDILLIDGWHSVNTCVNDWGYADMISNGGAVILHDTNAHPGCCALYHAVDDNLFIKERFCTGPDDMGIAVFIRR